MSRIGTFQCPVAFVHDVMTVANVAWTKPTFTVVVSDDDNVLSYWTVALVRPDKTYILNPSSGTYSGVSEIQINGLSYQQTTSSVLYYQVYANGSVVFDGDTTRDTTRNHFDLAQDMEIRTTKVGNTVRILNGGYEQSEAGDQFPSYPNYWTITLGHLDGETTTTVSTWGDHDGMTSLQVSGAGYVPLTEGDFAYYRVTGRYTNRLYYDGTTEPSRTLLEIDPI